MFPNTSVVFLLFQVSKLFIVGGSDASSTQAESAPVVIHCKIMIRFLDNPTTFVYLKIVSFTQQAVFVCTYSVENQF